MIYDVTFGVVGWNDTYTLLISRLREHLFEYNETGTPSEEYKRVYSICQNMLIGKYGYDEYKNREDEEVQEFFDEFPWPWGA